MGPFFLTQYCLNKAARLEKNKNMFGSKSKGIEFIHFLIPYKEYPSSIVGPVRFLKEFDSNKKTCTYSSVHSKLNTVVGQNLTLQTIESINSTAIFT